MFGVSGILSAVACGLVFDLRGNGTGADVSRSKIVSSGVWKVISFALNGIVFVLLGLQLPNGVQAITSPDVDTLLGFSAVAIVLGIVVAFRFVWCLVISKASRRGWGDAGENIGVARTAGLLTFVGNKLACVHVCFCANAERISSLIRDYRLDMARTLAYTPQLEDVARVNSQAAKLRLEALSWEGELIEEWLDEGRISDSTARAMHRTVDVIRFDAEDMI